MKETCGNCKHCKPSYKKTVKGGRVRDDRFYRFGRFKTLSFLWRQSKIFGMMAGGEFSSEPVDFDLQDKSDEMTEVCADKSEEVSE